MMARNSAVMIPVMLYRMIIAKSRMSTGFDRERAWMHTCVGAIAGGTPGTTS